MKHFLPPHTPQATSTANSFPLLPLRLPLFLALPFQNSNDRLRLLPRLLRSNLSSTIPKHPHLIRPHPFQSPLTPPPTSPTIQKRIMQRKEETYQAIVAIPNTPLPTLKHSATIPLHVNPAGSGPGGLFAPSRSNTFSVFPTAFP